MTQAGGPAGAPARTGKKMRKRRELDALVGYAGGGAARRAAPLLLASAGGAGGCSSDERDELEAAWGARGARARARRAGGAARACAALLLCACATATATVVWLFIDVREQITALRSEMELVSMGSQGVGDALQRCHSVARELQHNHTEMAARLDHLLLRTDNLTAQMASMGDALDGVKKQVAGAPELVSVPQQLSALGTSVARFGSQIKDLDSTVTALRAQGAATADGQAALHHNVTELKDQVELLRNSTRDASNGSRLDGRAEAMAPVIKQQAELQAELTQLATNVSLINRTLGTQIKWATQDFEGDHRKVSGLLDTVQNNSAALSSLQTAWRQSNDLITRNISELSQKVADKAAELERQLSELRALQSQLAAAQVIAPPAAVAPEAPAAPFKLAPVPLVPPASETAPAHDQAVAKNLHERNVSVNEDLAKILASSEVPPSGTTKAVAPNAPSATGKPSIVRSAGV